MWEASIKQETNQRGESGVNQARAHVDQADGGGGHLEGDGEVRLQGGEVPRARHARRHHRDTADGDDRLCKGRHVGHPLLKWNLVGHSFWFIN